MIDGVVFKELKSFADERGLFREIIRKTDPFFAEGFGQLSYSQVYTGVAKAWHIHKIQVDWWHMLGGVFVVVLHDTREGSPTYRETMRFLLGDNQASQVVRIPQGVAHGYKCIEGPGQVLYVTSHVYNPDDEGRIPHDDPDIGFDWVSRPEIN